MIRDIFFDLDDTLLDFAKAEAYALPRTFADHGITLTDDLLAQYHIFNSAQWKALEDGQLTQAEVNYNRFALTLEWAGSDANPQELADGYERYLGDGHYFIDGALDLLEVLSQKYRLHLVSNGIHNIQMRRLTSADIMHYFQHIFISEDIGVNKPSREFFEFCTSQVEGYEPEASVIIGDSLNSDIRGGQNAGMYTIWFNPQNKPNGSDIHPDREVECLMQIPDLLEEL